MNKKEIKKGRHPRMFLSGISLIGDMNKGKSLFIHSTKAGDSRQRLSGMTTLFNNGFTLIELLVVVLIIGVLTAIALPQYQKSVRLARLAEFASLIKPVQQAIEVYILENGFPTNKNVMFVGSSNSGALSIEIPGVPCTAGANCLKNIGAYDIGCSFRKFCGITLRTQYKEDGTTGNTWLNGGSIGLVYLADKPEWALGVVPEDISARKLVCQWWRGKIVDATDTNAEFHAKTDCSAVGIE